MPSLGGVTAWIQIGDTRLHELGVEITDDQATCYVEVPNPPPTLEQLASLSTSQNIHHSSSQSPSDGTVAAPLEYSINWKISDLTYTLAVKVIRKSLSERKHVH